MAYDEELAKRIRSVLVGETGIEEKKMFGGVAFMKEGVMFCGIVGGRLMARVGPEAHEKALARPHTSVMDFTGRPMKGYIYVDPEGIPTKREISSWVRASLAHAGTLPRKGPKKK